MIAKFWAIRHFWNETDCEAQEFVTFVTFAGPEAAVRYCSTPWVMINQRLSGVVLVHNRTVRIRHEDEKIPSAIPMRILQTCS
jgi:hypothetical protein